MKYNFTSVLAPEINAYLKLLIGKGQKNIVKTRSQLWRFDQYLAEKDWCEKILTSPIISDWINMQNVRVSTKNTYITKFNGFVKYMRSLGLKADCPEPLKNHSSYVAYIFSDEELKRIFLLADNYEASVRFSRRTFTFPILLRILLGSGLRLGEASSLQWKDVDLEQGIITVSEAKNQKQRFVPMSTSLTQILKDYQAMVRHEKICDDYLFESNYGSGRPIFSRSFYYWFRIILQKSGVEYAKIDSYERGPCVHCLRHTFTMKSFLQSEDKGRRFEDTAPFLAAYLGHDGPQYTETYLSSNHLLYTRSHQRVNAAVGSLFPEVCFDED